MYKYFEPTGLGAAVYTSHAQCVNIFNISDKNIAKMICEQSGIIITHIWHIYVNSIKLVELQFAPLRPYKLSTFRTNWRVNSPSARGGWCYLYNLRLARAFVMTYLFVPKWHIVNTIHFVVISSLYGRQVDAARSNLINGVN